MIKETEFKYCPKCATEFGPIQGNVLICPSCDLHYYINPKPANAVILENAHGEILLVVRAYEPKKGMLDVPGGFIDTKETIEESITRELKEELGLDLHEFTYVASCPDEYAYGGVSSKSLCILFKAKLPEGTELHPADDVESYEWFSKDAIPYEKIAFKGIRSLLRTLYA